MPEKERHGTADHRIIASTTVLACEGSGHRLPGPHRRVPLAPRYPMPHGHGTRSCGVIERQRHSPAGQKLIEAWHKVPDRFTGYHPGRGATALACSGSDVRGRCGEGSAVWTNPMTTHRSDQSKELR
ncbi:MAG: hypothetical protein KGL03_10830 [Nitrospirota bacterium]|nr:hypothetical protein [Nitrospirota bacterium]